MSHADISPGKSVQRVRGKDFRNKAHSFMDLYTAFWPFRIAHCDAAAFLSAMLKSQKSIVNRGGDIISVKIIDSENTAFLMESVKAVRCHIRQISHKFMSFPK